MEKVVIVASTGNFARIQTRSTLLQCTIIRRELPDLQKRLDPRNPSASSELSAASSSFAMAATSQFRHKINS